MKLIQLLFISLLMAVSFGLGIGAGIGIENNRHECPPTATTSHYHCEQAIASAEAAQEYRADYLRCSQKNYYLEIDKNRLKTQNDSMMVALIDLKHKWLSLKVNQ